LTLLKNAKLILVNSSSGIREAPVYGIYTINVGTRQNNRFNYKSILNADNNPEVILSAIKKN
jgi:UDP-N-acetylglucosamine 2-epimerase (hydrolysing)